MMFRRVKQWIVIIGILPFTGCVSFETDILARKAPSVPPSAQPGDQFSESATLTASDPVFYALPPN